ncbi:hypothetical protein B0H13DRAFT_1888470 [Mycena leptocephala]|nr:hypothetical protein B0H13DRAFT_1888470 [Mycena leptocephala]
MTVGSWHLIGRALTLVMVLARHCTNPFVPLSAWEFANFAWALGFKPHAKQIHCTAGVGANKGHKMYCVVVSVSSPSSLVVGPSDTAHATLAQPAPWLSRRSSSTALPFGVILFLVLAACAIIFIIATTFVRRWCCRPDRRTNIDRQAEEPWWSFMVPHWFRKKHQPSPPPPVALTPSRPRTNRHPRTNEQTRGSGHHQTYYSTASSADAIASTPPPLPPLPTTAALPAAASASASSLLPYPHFAHVASASSTSPPTTPTIAVYVASTSPPTTPTSASSYSTDSTDVKYMSIRILRTSLRTSKPKIRTPKIRTSSSTRRKVTGVHFAKLPADWVEAEGQWAVRELDIPFNLDSRGELERDELKSYVVEYNLIKTIRSKSRRCVIQALFDYAAKGDWSNLSPQAQRFHKFHDPDDQVMGSSQSNTKKIKTNVFKRRVEAIKSGELPRPAPPTKPTLPASKLRKPTQTKEQREAILLYVQTGSVVFDHPPLPPSERWPPIVKSDTEWKAEMSTQLTTVSNAVKSLAHAPPTPSPIIPYRLTQMAVGILQQISVATEHSESEVPIVIDLLQQALARLQISPAASRTSSVEIPPTPQEFSFPFPESSDPSADPSSSDSSLVDVDMLPPDMSSYVNAPHSSYPTPSITSSAPSASTTSSSRPKVVDASHKPSLKPPVKDGLLSLEPSTVAIDTLLRHWKVNDIHWRPDEDWFQLDDKYVPLSSYPALYKKTMFWTDLRKTYSKWQSIVLRYEALGDQFWVRYQENGKPSTITSILKDIASENKNEAERIRGLYTPQAFALKFSSPAGSTLTQAAAIIARHEKLRRA